MEATAAFEEVGTSPVFTEERINVLRKLLVTSFQRLKCGYELALEPEATAEQRRHANALKAEFQEVLVTVHGEYSRSTTPTENLVHYAHILFQEISVYDNSVEVRFPEFPEEGPEEDQYEHEDVENDEEEGEEGDENDPQEDLEETLVARIRGARQIPAPANGPDYAAPTLHPRVCARKYRRSRK